MFSGNLVAVLIIIIGSAIAGSVYLAGRRVHILTKGYNPVLQNFLTAALGLPAIFSILACTFYIAFDYAAELPPLVEKIFVSSIFQVI
ncbi:MAG TPA: hypothetical protein VN372_08765, partial [Methanospirillum sp.]|nr:hypothetical protein [Methanospirillum sp.]